MSLAYLTTRSKKKGGTYRNKERTHEGGFPWFLCLKEARKPRKRQTKQRVRKPKVSRDSIDLEKQLLHLHQSQLYDETVEGHEMLIRKTKAEKKAHHNLKNLRTMT